MTTNLQVRIISPTHVLLDEPASLVTMPGEDGEFGVLPLHAPLIASLKTGLIKISSTSGEYKYFTYNGIARVDGEAVDIITEFAMNLEEVQKSVIIEKINELKAKVDMQAETAKQKNFIQDIEKYQTLLTYL